MKLIITFQKSLSALYWWISFKIFYEIIERNIIVNLINNLDKRFTIQTYQKRYSIILIAYLKYYMTDIYLCIGKFYVQHREEIKEDLWNTWHSNSDKIIVINFKWEDEWAGEEKLIKSLFLPDNFKQIELELIVLSFWPLRLEIQKQTKDFIIINVQIYLYVTISSDLSR